MGHPRMIGAVLVLVVGLGACGGGGDGGAQQSPTEGAADLSGVKLEVAAVWVKPEQERFRKVLDAFEQKTGAKVTFTSTGDDIGAVIGPRIEGGSPPDVAILPQPGLLRDYVERGVLKPLDASVASVIDENYDPAWKELGTVDGKLYGAWFKATNKSTIWYRKDAFETAGVQPPETWDDLKTAAGTISDSGTTPFSIGAGDGWTLSDWFENIYIRVAGAESYDKLVEHKIPWTDATVKKALTTFAEIVAKKEWVAGGPSGALNTDFTNSVTQVFSDPAKAAMVYEGDFVAGVITGNTKAKLGEDADFFAFPSIEGSPASVVVSGDVAVQFKESEGATELLKFLASPESAEQWVPLGGYVSPNKKVDLSKYPDDITRRAAEGVVKAETTRFDLSDLQPAAFGSTTGKGIWGELQSFLRKPDVDATARKLEASAKAAFS